MPDDDSPSGSVDFGADLAERIQLCWSPTAQLPLEYGPEVRQDLFEQLLTDQVRQARRRGQPLPEVQYLAELVDDEPRLSAADGVRHLLIDIRASRCRVLPSLGRAPETGRFHPAEAAFEPTP